MFYICNSLTSKALQWPNLAHCCFGHVVVIRRCDMFFGEFYIRRELEGLSVKLNNARFGPLL
jgi:hypothetical protein